MFKNMELPKLKKQKYLVMTAVSVFLLAIFLFMIAAWANNSVNIYDGGISQNVKTQRQTVREVLDEAGITIGDFDKVEPDLDASVYNEMDIRISRAVKLSVIDNGVEIEYYSSASDIQGVLNQTGYTLGEHDVTVPDLSAEVTAGMKIEIRRANHLTVIDDDSESDVYSCARTVGELLNELTLDLTENDKVSLESDVVLKDGMKIKIARRSLSYIDETEEIPYKQVTKETNSLAKGKTRVAQEGKNGVRRITYEITTENGEEVSRKQIDSVVEKEPVNKVVEVGTYVAPSTPKASSSSSSGGSKASAPAQSSGGGTSSSGLNYSRVLTCTATAYDLSYESCGKRPGDPNYGITASGMKAQYGVIAVDPSVIPLGTKLYVEGTDGSWTYGYCVAGDTGGGIRGNRVDLFYNSRAEALQFGRRQARVYVLY